MTQPIVIPRIKSVDNSENYQFLRQEGLQYIEDLSSNLWTDYNVHDPGVTFVEALCYAITDLGYRTGLPMKDLMAKEDAGKKPPPPLFSARNILTNNPLTITDFRKLLVDVEGVKNAWFEVAECQEVNFHAECESSTLRYFDRAKKIKAEKLKIENNISAVLMEFINDPDSRDGEVMNFPLEIKAFDAIQGIDISYTLLIPLPGWLTFENNRDAYLDFVNMDSFVNIFLQNVSFDNVRGIWQADILLQFETNGTNDFIRFPNIVVTGVNDLSIRTALESVMGSIASANPLYDYQRKLKKELALATEHTIRLRGLNEVILEYDVDDRYGDLNSDLLYYKMVINEFGAAKDVNLEIDMPSWNKIYSSIQKTEKFILADSFSFSILNSFEDDVNNQVTTDIALNFVYQGDALSMNWDNIVFKGISDLAELQLELQNILAFFQGKLRRLLTITRDAIHTLHEHRNLCEDIKKVSTVLVNEIGVCADVILENNVSLIKTQAQILFEIQNYISPPIRFYSLKEMVGKDIPSEEIFNGPKLQHGFIIDEEIEKSSLDERRFIYASDIINIIQDIPGVIAIKDLQLTKYDTNGNPILPSERWCVRIDPNHKAELSLTKSKLLYFKEDLPYVLSDEQYEKMLLEMDKLKAISERFRLVNPENDFPMPEGTPFDLADYTPLRFSLPQTYGVGVFGLPPAVSNERKAQAKQLNAFLAIYDQLLGNYLSQLANIGEVFSIDKQELAKEKKTYYNQFLSEEQLGAQLYFSADTLEDASGTTIGQTSLQRMTESHEDYLDRRNRFLDHLLARFAEDFTDYALMIFNTVDNDAQQELINDKVSFLEEYPTISAERGKGFNYKNEEELWDTTNVAGLKKRVSKLLGMPNYLRQNYHCPTIRDEFEIYKSGTKFAFRFTQGNTVILKSAKLFDTEDEAFYAKELAIELAQDIANYDYRTTGSSTAFEIGILDPNDPALHDIFLFDGGHATLSDAKTAAKDFQALISRDFSRAPIYDFQLFRSGANYTLLVYHHDAKLLVSDKTYTDEALALLDKTKAMLLSQAAENYTTKAVGANFIFQIGVLDEADPLNNDIYLESGNTYTTAAEAALAGAAFREIVSRSCVECQPFDATIGQSGPTFSLLLKKGLESQIMGFSPYTSDSIAQLAREEIINLAYEENSYTTATTGANFIYQIGRVTRDQATGVVLTNDVKAISSNKYATEAEALEAGIQLQRSLNGIPHCEVEGMHLIEHILLRPKHENKDDFFEVCLGDNCNFCGEEDPYSFRASAVMPYWVRKFSIDDPKLRKREYVDRLLRQEAPAHVHLKTCWIDNYQMRQLDIHYRRWLEENAKLYPNADALTLRLNALLDILGKLRSRYPEGFLHDCDDSEEENTILLGKSFLGSFNSAEGSSR